MFALVFAPATVSPLVLRPTRTAYCAADVVKRRRFKKKCHSAVAGRFQTQHKDLSKWAGAPLLASVALNQGKFNPTDPPMHFLMPSDRLSVASQHLEHLWTAYDLEWPAES